MVFFFQAEDGIRDLRMSRGLGDVYKRQGHLYKSKILDLKTCSRLLSDIANEFNDKTEYELFGMDLEDSFYLANQKIYGNLNYVEEKLIEYTSPYNELGKSFLRLIKNN